MWITFLEWSRWVVMFLGLINLGWLLLRISNNWESYPSGIERGMSITLVLFVLAATYGSGEGIYRDLPIGSRTVIILVAQVDLLILLWVSRGRTLFNLSGSGTQK